MHSQKDFGQIRADICTQFKNMGLRCTRSRLQLVEGILFLRGKGHFDMDNLYIQLRKHGMSVSRASLYRNLPLLQNMGLVRTLRIDSRTFYECMLDQQHHDHLVCNHCGVTIPVYSHELEQIQHSLCVQNGFIESDHSLVIRGICKSCAAKQENSK